MEQEGSLRIAGVKAHSPGQQDQIPESESKEDVGTK